MNGRLEEWKERGISHLFVRFNPFNPRNTWKVGGKADKGRFSTMGFLLTKDLMFLAPLGRDKLQKEADGGRRRKYPARLVLVFLKAEAHYSIERLPQN